MAIKKRGWAVKKNNEYYCGNDTWSTVAQEAQLHSYWIDALRLAIELFPTAPINYNGPLSLDCSDGSKVESVFVS